MGEQNKIKKAQTRKNQRSSLTSKKKLERGTDTNSHKTITPKAPLPGVEEIPIGLKDSKLRVVMVQLEGPLPYGKTVIASQGRETFEWQSLQEINKRKAKVSITLDFLHEHHPDTDIVIFPEYSLPVEELLPTLREKAELYNQIIIAGSDNIREKNKRYILNKCPILIPGQPTVWVVKRHLSQWETQYVDEPALASNPVLTWKTRGRKHWLAVHICLDFTYLTQDPLHNQQDPVIYVVPMCSPDNQTFRTYADTALLEDGGRAVILCNCTGERWAGASSLFAVTPAGVRLLPAYELPKNKEGFAFFELDCEHLVLPRRSTKSTRSALSRITHLRTRASGRGVPN
jgi:hypothetical protein